ncbi:hypothetical protein HC891_10000, partial [Candidatus Gracilibacteria bacterium]|nr:hypothetical protein [Candidatus Gracilibacteria bacterium]
GLFPAEPHGSPRPVQPASRRGRLFRGTWILRDQASRGLELPKVIIALHSIDELSRITRTESRFDIGATVPLKKIVKTGRKILPGILIRTLDQIAPPSVFNLATLGGNVCVRHRDDLYRRSDRRCIGVGHRAQRGEFTVRVTLKSARPEHQVVDLRAAHCTVFRHACRHYRPRRRLTACLRGGSRCGCGVVVTTGSQHQHQHADKAKGFELALHSSSLLCVGICHYSLSPPCEHPCSIRCSTTPPLSTPDNDTARRGPQRNARPKTNTPLPVLEYRPTALCQGSPGDNRAPDIARIKLELPLRPSFDHRRSASSRRSHHLSLRPQKAVVATAYIRCTQCSMCLLAFTNGVRIILPGISTSAQVVCLQTQLALSVPGAVSSYKRLARHQRCGGRRAQYLLELRVYGKRGLFQGTSATPARELAARASTKSISERRFR